MSSLTLFTAFSNGMFLAELEKRAHNGADTGTALWFPDKMVYLE